MYERTRADHATEMAEDYVEFIGEFSTSGTACRSVDLSKHFGVSAVTVNRNLARLQRDGYVQTEPYGPVFLTAKGNRLAKYAKRRHRIVFEFLIALGVKRDTAMSDSEGIEHHVSKETLKAMQKFLRSSSDAL